MNFFVFGEDLLKHTSQNFDYCKETVILFNSYSLALYESCSYMLKKVILLQTYIYSTLFFQISTDMNNFSSLTCTLNNSSCLITVIKCVLWNFNLENMQNCQRRQLSSNGGLQYFGYAENLIHSAALNGLNTSLRVVWSSRGTRKGQTPVYARFDPVCWKGTDDNHHAIQVKQFGYLALFIELQKGWKR